jgi:hypothetical protein
VTCLENHFQSKWPWVGLADVASSNQRGFQVICFLHKLNSRAGIEDYGVVLLTVWIMFLLSHPRNEMLHSCSASSSMTGLVVCYPNPHNSKICPWYKTWLQSRQAG